MAKIKQIVTKKELAVILEFIKDDLDKLHLKMSIIGKQLGLIVEMMELDRREKKK